MINAASQSGVTRAVAPSLSELKQLLQLAQTEATAAEYNWSLKASNTNRARTHLTNAEEQEDLALEEWCSASEKLRAAKIAYETALEMAARGEGL